MEVTQQHQQNNNNNNKTPDSNLIKVYITQPSRKASSVLNSDIYKFFKYFPLNNPSITSHTAKLTT